MALVTDKKINPNYLLLGILGVTYTILFFAAQQLQGPFWSDEGSFYHTSQQFSHQLIPSLEQLKNYRELNTPLPFILYGQLQYLFNGGVFAGRLLNFFLSMAIALFIGWPGRNRKYGPILALLGVFLYPYFLWYSTRYFTDIIAAFFALLGLLLYRQQRHIPSGIVFVLAIAARQYMLAFPLAVAAHELVVAIRDKKRPSLSFFLPALAAISILGWVLIFGGLAPTGALQTRNAPPVQLSVWQLTPSSGLYALACVGFFYVLPEWVLFRRSFNWRSLFTRKPLIIAAGLLTLVIIFPPHLIGKGVIWKLAEPEFLAWLRPFYFYALSLIAAWRFVQFNLSFWLVLCHVLIMMKAYPWDKYALPILLILWFLKAEEDRIVKCSPEKTVPECRGGVGSC
jgi:hypothetical protein